MAKKGVKKAQKGGSGGPGDPQKGGPDPPKRAKKGGLDPPGGVPWGPGGVPPGGVPPQGGWGAQNRTLKRDPPAGTPLKYWYPCGSGKTLGVHHENLAKIGQKRGQKWPIFGGFWLSEGSPMEPQAHTPTRFAGGVSGRLIGYGAGDQKWGSGDPRGPPQTLQPAAGPLRIESAYALEVP